jgi:hypothetical protein
MTVRIIFNPDGSSTTVDDGIVESPDDTPDEDTRVLRRVLIRFMSDSGQTVPQIRARFAAAKRAVD